MKNIKNLITVVILMMAISIITSCNTKHTDNDGHDHGAGKEHLEIEKPQNHDGHNHDEADHDEAGHDEADHKGGSHEEGAMSDEHDDHEEGLHLTREQIETIGLEFGELSSVKVNDYVNATGTLGLPPNAFSSVSAKSEGIIKGVKKLVEGNFIKKGTLIAYVENPDFIVKQQEYLALSAELKLKRQDLVRQRELIAANAGVTKHLQDVQAAIAILEAKSIGLSKQLGYLGISVNNLTPSNISHRISILAPMSGYISSINMHNGMYAQPAVSLLEILATDHIHLELDVFEKDIASIKVGQKITYTVPAIGDKIYEGEVSVLGKEFDANNKTVRIHGHLENEKPLFIKDLFINSKIWLNNITTQAVPQAAVIKDGTNSYLYVAMNNKDTKETEFKKIMVIPGSTNNGYTAIKLIDKIPEGMLVVIKGAYYVYAQSQAGELAHEH